MLCITKYLLILFLAVKNEQISQLDLLLRELENEKAICAQLKAEVNKMEQEVVRKATTKSSFPYVSCLS